ncbi:MAG: HAMP domain-containing histidine kinase [Caldilineaceae bacterium]|nr:HAMP domain-containing histidine kinase [Caldilineaceae bacterium]
MSQRLTAFNIYLFIIDVVGLMILGLGISHFPIYTNQLNFFLLIGLAIIAAVAPMAAAAFDDSGINYGLGAVVSLAAFPSYGPAAATLIVAIYSLAFWLGRPADRRTWQKNARQLLFNISMQVIAVFVAGQVFRLCQQWLGADTLWGQLLPWLPTAFVYVEVNIWLLIGVLRLQRGPIIQPLAIWREERAASQILLLATALGGGTLGYAVVEFDWVGVIIFFWPILLSVFAFRLYVQQVQNHLENLEQIIAERTKDLAELNRQKDAYLAVLTHDMMTPLTSIRLCAEELQADPQSAVDNPSLITFLLRSQRTLFTIVRNILDVEKLQAGGSLSAKKTICDLAQTLLTVVGIVQNEANEKQVTIDHAIPSHSLLVYADRNQLERILMNLLSNAVKYTPQGGNVQVCAERKGTQVIVRFADTGYGVPPEELPYIFDRFRRVEQHKEKATGTGLGLAITKALIEEHGGTITVESQVGQGSIFTINLPVGIAQVEGRRSE